MSIELCIFFSYPVVGLGSLEELVFLRVFHFLHSIPSHTWLSQLVVGREADIFMLLETPAEQRLQNGKCGQLRQAEDWGNQQHLQMEKDCPWMVLFHAVNPIKTSIGALDWASNEQLSWASPVQSDSAWWGCYLYAEESKKNSQELVCLTPTMCSPPPFFFLWWNHILILSKVNVSLTRKRSLWAHFFSSAIHITHSYWCGIESWFCDFMQDLQPPMEGHCCLGSSTRSRLHPAQAQARAISLAVKIATARNWRTVIILSDAQDIALAIQQDRIPPWVCKTAIHADVKQLAVSSDVSECYWIPGTFNSSAHSLCRYGKRTARSELRFSEKCSPALLETNMEKMKFTDPKKKSYVIRTMQIRTILWMQKYYNKHKIILNHR